MKKVSLLIILAALLFCTMTNAKDLVINTPSVKFSNSELTIKQIIQTDTATVLCFSVDCKSRPWTLQSTVHLRANGKNYAYRHGKLVSKKEHRMIDSPFAVDSVNVVSYTKIGEKYIFDRDSLVLSFDRIPSEIQFFDFLEGEEHNSWKTYGIKMDGKPYPSSLPKIKKTPDTGLPPYAIQSGKGVLKGRVHDYNSSFMKNSFGYFANKYNLVGNQMDIQMQIDTLGNFSFELELLHPVPVTFVFPGGYLKAILVPGEEMELDVDVAARIARAPYEYWEQKPKLNKALQFRGKYGSMNEALNEETFGGYTVDFLKELVTISFDEYTQRIWGDYLKKLETLAENKEYNMQQREYLKLKVQSTYLYKRISYLENVKNGFYYSDMKADSLTMDKYQAQFTLKDPHAQELNLFDNLNALYVVYDDRPMEYLKANGLDQSELYQWMADLRKAKELASQINMMKVVKDSTVWSSIASQYTPVLRQLNDTVIHQMKEAERLQLKGNRREVPDVPGKELIQAIVDSYKGKVVMVDCWATWCGPCKKGIAKMEPVKEELEGKDVVFVYLTNETSDVTSWMKEIEQLKGEHYRISSQKWSQLPDISAIPHYMIFDRQGNKLMDEVGWSDALVDKFKEVIVKALEDKE